MSREVCASDRIWINATAPLNEAFEPDKSVRWENTVVNGAGDRDGDKRSESSRVGPNCRLARDLRQHPDLHRSVEPQTLTPFGIHGGVDSVWVR
jgi:hypothetical protein